MREYVRFSKNKYLHWFLAELFDTLEILLTVMFCIILLFTYVVQVATVQGSSMLPTLENEDKLLVSVMYPEPENGDVVIIDAKESVLLNDDGSLHFSEGLGKVIVKRVIAVGGQTLDIDFDAGVVYVDQQPLSEEYVNTLTTTPSAGGAFVYPITIPEGYVFVMGDNREVSKDSRYPDVGLIHESDIVGRVVLRMQPWDAFGLIS